MASRNNSVFGIYRDRPNMEEAIEKMRAAGFRGTDISVMIQENLGSKDFAHEKNSKAPEGAVAGALAGGILGGVLAWLIAAGIVSIPHLNLLVTAGPIVATLAGIGALGALGAIIGALAGSTSPEYEARRFEGRTKHGGVLVSVHCDNGEWVKRARQLLRDTGAEDIAAAGEAHADFSVSDKPTPRLREGVGTVHIEDTESRRSA